VFAPRLIICPRIADLRSSQSVYAEFAIGKRCLILLMIAP
jgi:hypothetical protein